MQCGQQNKERKKEIESRMAGTESFFGLDNCLSSSGPFYRITGAHYPSITTFAFL
jgi:predicted secreted Zn-dependent protease